MRHLLLSLALVAAALPACAQERQQQRQSDPDQNVTNGGQLPSGWQARLDRPNARLADLRFVTMGSGFHTTSGPAAIFWNPRDMVQGAYTAQATFTQTKAPMHPEAYGLFVGGQNLTAADQSYMYFLVRGDGKYLIKHRAGPETHTITDWTDHAAIRRADESGKATNTIAINVTADRVRFLANGTEVASFPKGQAMMQTDGQAGLRVNHNLDVHIDAFGVRR
jgi:hypothetical protein